MFRSSVQLYGKPTHQNLHRSCARFPGIRCNQLCRHQIVVRLSGRKSAMVLDLNCSKFTDTQVPQHAADWWYVYFVDVFILSMCMMMSFIFNFDRIACTHTCLCWNLSKVLLWKRIMICADHSLHALWLQTAPNLSVSLHLRSHISE